MIYTYFGTKTKCFPSSISHAYSYKCNAYICYNVIRVVQGFFAQLAILISSSKFIYYGVQKNSEKQNHY